MRRYIILLLSILPVFAFAQSSEDNAGVIGIFLGIAIFIGLFFIFRAILHRYSRTNDVVKSQEETKQLMRSVVRDLESKDSNIKNPDR